MDKHIIKTDFESMYDTHIDLYKCPCCGNETLSQRPHKWLTEHFSRFTCDKCRTYIYITDKNCKVEELD